MSTLYTRFEVQGLGIYEAVDVFCPRGDDRRKNKPDGSWLPKVGDRFEGAISYWKEKGLKVYEESRLKAWHASVVPSLSLYTANPDDLELCYEDDFQVIGRLKPEKFLNDLIRDLKSRFSCHTFILYGSRARSDFNSQSDWDLQAFCDEGERVRDARKWRGQYLDTWIEPVKSVEVIGEEHLKLRNARVIEEKNSFGTQLLMRVNEFYEVGPKSLQAWERELHQSWIQKMLDRSSTRDVEGDFRLHWLLSDSLKIYFELRGQWYLGPKESLTWLENHDPTAFNVFKRALAAQASREDIASLATLLLKL